MRKWLTENFLPMWAKETVLPDNRQLMAENRRLYQHLQEKDAYIRGLELGLRAVRKVVIHNTGGEK